MTLIICVDEGRGVTFFGKRQSADRAVRDRIISLAAGAPIYMTGYSASMFRGTAADVRVVDDLSRAPLGAVCFAESADLSAVSGKVSRLVLYRWNRKYPRDGAVNFYPFDEGLRLSSIKDFAGTSHDRVTEEIWEAI